MAQVRRVADLVQAGEAGGAARRGGAVGQGGEPGGRGPQREALVEEPLGEVPQCGHHPGAGRGGQVGQDDAAFEEPGALLGGEAYAVGVGERPRHGVAVPLQGAAQVVEPARQVGGGGPGAEQPGGAAHLAVPGAGVVQCLVAGAAAGSDRARGLQPRVALHGVGQRVVQQHGQFGGHGVAGARAGDVLAGQGVEGLPPRTRAGFVGQAVLHDPGGRDGDAVHDVAEGPQHGVEHLGLREEFHEGAQSVGVALGERVEEPQHSGGGRPQGQGAAQDPALGAADGQADDPGGSVGVELLVEELVGDQPVRVVDDDEAPLVAAGLRGVERGPHGVAAGRHAAQVEGDGVVGRAVVRRGAGGHAGVHSSSPSRAHG
ncbi:hypothetical protein [Streptomyces sp. CC210A]|uniref:hypothetical protein n=1 Tax=Streptomyces sp. CC210A TaxID=2898184 RepID=UPI001F36D116|nr:hypothetical protein [Streptomyces sp. CC210A]